jgi:hypothetical protein
MIWHQYSSKEKREKRMRRKKFIRAQTELCRPYMSHHHIDDFDTLSMPPLRVVFDHRTLPHAPSTPWCVPHTCHQPFFFFLFFNILYFTKSPKGSLALLRITKKKVEIKRQKHHCKKALIYFFYSRVVK